MNRIAVGVVATILVGVPAAAQELSRYVVFRLEDGRPVPMKHDLVSLRRVSRSEADQRRALDLTPAGTDRAGITVVDAAGAVVFRDVADVVRFGHGHGLPGEAIGEPVFESRDEAFVARVPYLPGTRLRLEIVEGGRRFVTRAPASPVELDLDALARDPDLPLASFAPTSERRAVRGPLAETRDSGPLAAGIDNRMDLLFMGDGYTAAERATFDTDVANLSDAFFGVAPYSTYRGHVRTAALFTASTGTGADHPPYQSSCSGTQVPPTCCADTAAQSDPKAGTFVDTPFDASFCRANQHRLLTITPSKVLAAAAAAPSWDRIMVVVNDATYGGSGGSISVASTHSQAVGIARHEFGHAFTKLADEYETPYPGYPSCTDLGGGAACEANVTDQTARSAIKWRSWIAPSTPVPTTGGGVIGLYQGARYQSSGLYRPKDTCLMRTLGVPFCEVCAQEFVLALYRGGDWSPSDGIDLVEPGSESPAPGPVPLALPGSVSFSARVLSPSGGPDAEVVWLVDGAQAATGTAFTFTPVGPGTSTVTLRVRDVSPLVKAEMAVTGTGRNLIERTRTWTVTATGAASGAGSISFQGASSSVSEGAGTATLTLTRSGGSTSAVSVAIGATGGTAISGTDYGLGSSAVSWADGDAGPKTVTVTLVDDAAVEGSETAVFSISSPTGGATLGATTSHTLTISDDDETTEVPGACTPPSTTALCPLDRRFTVSLTAKDPRTGRTGTGQSLPQSKLFGYFSLPELTGDPGNPEVFVKMLDGRAVNGRFWLFHNGLTDLEYTLTVKDEQTGSTKTFTKLAGAPDPAKEGSCGSFDVTAFPGAAAGAALGDLPARAACAAGPGNLCALSSRFQITLAAKDPRTGKTGAGQAIPQNDLFGYFSIPALTSDPTNPEVFVKMLDGRVVNGRFWLFHAGLTDFEYTVTVADTTEGTTKTYTKPAGSACGGFDVGAF